MKALLRYGKFTHFMDIPRILPDIKIIKPIVYTAKPLTGDKPNPADYHPMCMSFRYTKMLADDVAEYVFMGEV
jgi:hypothetical protein